MAKPTTKAEKFKEIADKYEHGRETLKMGGVNVIVTDNAEMHIMHSSSRITLTAIEAEELRDWIKETFIDKE